jgi:hypothetical protein
VDRDLVEQAQRGDQEAFAILEDQSPTTSSFRGEERRSGSLVRLPAVQIGPMLVALVLAACSNGAPSATPSTPPAESQPTPTDVATVVPSPADAPVPRTMLVDTDVAADDLVALAFLIVSPQVNLAGITVSGTGEAHCAGGVDVVLRLLDTLDPPDIPVACGLETPLAGSHAFPERRGPSPASPAQSAGIPTSRT